MNNRKLSPANLVILVAGAVMFGASFLGYYRFSIPSTDFAGVTLPGRTFSVNAWHRGLFIVYTLPALIGAVMAAQVGFDAAGNFKLSRRPLGLTWDQVHLVLAVQAALMMGAAFVQSRNDSTFGIGFWLMSAAAVALVVGALMRTRAAGRRPRAV